MVVEPLQNLHRTISRYVIYTVFLKTLILAFGYNFCDYWPIKKIRPPADSQGKFLCIYNRDFHLTLCMLLYYLVKCENAK